MTGGTFFFAPKNCSIVDSWVIKLFHIKGREASINDSNSGSASALKKQKTKTKTFY